MKRSVMTDGVAGQVTGSMLRERGLFVLHSRQTQRWQSLTWDVSKNKAGSKKTYDMWGGWVDNLFGSKGACALVDVLWVNTTLTKLYLGGEQQDHRATQQE